MSLIIEKYSIPTKNDEAPPGSIWKAKLDLGDVYWIQVHEANQEPKWMKLGHFMVDGWKSGLVPDELITIILAQHSLFE